MFVVNFFKGLFRMRVNRVQGAAKSKVMGMQAKAKSAATNKVNKAMDAPGKALKKKAKGGHGKKNAGAGKKGENKMGWFSRKKSGNSDVPEGAQSMADEEKTQLIEIPEEERFKPCVGWLVIWEGPLKGKDFRLVEGRNRIGRRADLEVVLSDPEVEPEHAHIVFTRNHQYFLSDEGTSAGTYVNGERLMETNQVVDNDEIRIGKTVLRFKALY